jgi:hypothetical protein
MNAIRMPLVVSCRTRTSQPVTFPLRCKLQIPSRHTQLMSPSGLPLRLKVYRNCYYCIFSLNTEHSLSRTRSGPLRCQYIPPQFQSFIPNPTQSARYHGPYQKFVAPDFIDDAFSIVSFEMTSFNDFLRHVYLYKSFIASNSRHGLSARCLLAYTSRRYSLRWRGALQVVFINHCIHSLLVPSPLTHSRQSAKSAPHPPSTTTSPNANPSSAKPPLPAPKSSSSLKQATTSVPPRSAPQSPPRPSSSASAPPPSSTPSPSASASTSPPPPVAEK